MAKFRAAGRRKAAPAGPRPNAVGCIILLVLIFFLIFGAMYYTVRQA
jgi:hypothetical protein